ncbi:MAG: hypothetical protein IM568_04770 [Flavobacterium sp.]|nr:hypothetical protein [Flavobacterium sp.]
MEIELLDISEIPTEKYGREDIISIFCYNKTWKDFSYRYPNGDIGLNHQPQIRRFKKTYLDNDKVCYVYVFDKNDKTCKELYMICGEDYYNKIIENNFDIRFKTIEGQILINNLSEINQNGLNEDEIGEICLEENINCLSIKYGREDINHTNSNNGKYRYKVNHKL